MADERELERLKSIESLAIAVVQGVRKNQYETFLPAWEMLKRTVDPHGRDF